MGVCIYITSSADEDEQRNLVLNNKTDAQIINDLEYMYVLWKTGAMPIKVHIG